MKKQILNLGKGLSKAQQKLINGGREEEFCKDAGALCHTSNTNPNTVCCGDCGNVSRGWGICE